MLEELLRAPVQRVHFYKVRALICALICDETFTSVRYAIRWRLRVASKIGMMG